ncbi:hypothetical protein SC1083_1724 [Aggregatibacter actinomycetemcomitans serotype e str. SC1083]|uniref:Uncharacterized protein n=1 Tax=Aggregatibacter actinomycetemcomitans serotype e str. SC1083 TaxID=907488 RepID=G4AA51_AGGAC|nr:hypothetical protein SC1083_1724 [Aggregatibacter actinomycetemcomitans serotype e str. SC1083]KYK76455.1 hypothetical protein SA3096_01390 [Aggregatibacter actinomycetemcomitans serotype e str. SA3096]KYK82611.1 hypothetical protein SC936_01320 [Aggregatibacter actinomycetemcomitans serotype e str. SC936]KYK93637.1 hypothetical protein ANH9776_08210 [Aggregatibacter actinomycetemcomitans serotype e str. ANH9776]
MPLADIKTKIKISANGFLNEKISFILTALYFSIFRYLI